MSKKNYWFSARPPRNGVRLGWGMPLAWQGWAAYLAFMLLLSVGSHYVARYGNVILMGYICGLLITIAAVISWKGEPL